MGPICWIYTSEILSDKAMSMGTAFIIIHIKRRNLSGESSYDFGIGSIKFALLVCIVTVAILIGITFPIVSQIPMPDFLRKILLDQGDKTGVYSFIAVVIAAPILEELIFRGIILKGFLKSYSPLKSILISSLLFGLIHLNPWQFIGASILGIFSGWIYYKTNKLTLCILIHLTNNLLAFIGGYFNPKTTNINSTLSEVKLTELYGGTKSMIIILIGAIIIMLSSIFILNKEFRKEQI